MKNVLYSCKSSLDILFRSAQTNEAIIGVVDVDDEHSNGDTLIHLLVAVVRGFPSQDTPSLSLSLGVFAALSEWILLTPHLLVLVDGLFVVLFFLFLALLFSLKPLLFFYSLLLPCLSSLCRGPDNPGPEIHQCVP